MKNIKKTAAFLLGAAMAATLLGGCEGNSSGGETAAAVSKEAENMDMEETDRDMELTGSEINREFTDRDRDGSYAESEAAQIILNGSDISAEGSGVAVSGNTVTISEDGTYVVSGRLNDGQILVDAPDDAKIQIVLKNAEIYCETSAAIYIREADKVFLTLADGSSNALGGGKEYENTDENTVDGVVFSKADLTLNGSGGLEINAEYRHGIVSKDELVITGGVITVNAVKQCLSGKDSVRIADGVFVLHSEGKGIKSENTDDSTLGNIYVAGGEFTVQTADDGFHSSGCIVIDGGSFTVDSGDDAFHADADVVVNGGTVRVNSCYEGLEGYRVVINGGNIEIIASDDGLNAAAPKNAEDTEGQSITESQDGGAQDSGMLQNGKVTDEDSRQKQDGKLADEEKAQDGEMPNGEKAQGSEMPNGEKAQGGEMPNGEKAQGGEMPDGEMPQEENTQDGERPDWKSAQDGGLPGNDELPEGRAGDLPAGPMKGGGSIENDTNVYIKITGGEVTVTAGGDGLDSNGSLYLSGGTVCINGTASDGDSAIDYDGTAEVTGGILMASGSAGMAQGFGSSSSQCSILQVLEETQEAGSTVSLKDSDGTVLFSWTPSVRYSCVILTSPELELGNSYMLDAGDLSMEITLDSVSFSSKAGGMGGAGRQ